MECLVELLEPIAEMFGTNACVIATAIGELSLFVAVVAMVVDVAILMAVLEGLNPPGCRRKTVAERLERSARVVTLQVDPVRAQVSAIRKEAQKKADQAVKQAIEDIEHMIKTEVNV